MDFETLHKDWSGYIKAMASEHGRPTGEEEDFYQEGLIVLARAAEWDENSIQKSFSAKFRHVLRNRMLDLNDARGSRSKKRDYHKSISLTFTTSDNDDGEEYEIPCYHINPEGGLITMDIMNKMEKLLMDDPEALAVFYLMLDPSDVLDALDKRREHRMIQGVKSWSKVTDVTFSQYLGWSTTKYREVRDRVRRLAEWLMDSDEGLQYA